MTFCNLVSHCKFRAPILAAILSVLSISTQASITVSPATVNFGNETVGISSAPISVVLTDSSRSSAEIVGISTSSKVFLSAAPAMPVYLRRGQSLTASVEFLPFTATSYRGYLTFLRKNGSSITVALSGTGIAAQAAVSPQLTLSASAENFGSVPVGSVSTQSVLLTNPSSVALTISQIAAAGAGVSPGGIAAPMNLSAGQSTILSIGFAPTAAGAVSGSVSIASNAPSSPAMISVTGTGVQPQLAVSPLSVSFGSVNVGSSSVQTISVTNSGGANVTISQAASSGAGYSLTGPAVPFTLGPGNTASLSVQFAPQTGGSVSGSVMLASNAPGSPVTIALSGTGVAQVTHSVSLTWSPSSSSVAGYNVYRSSVSGGPYAKLTATLAAGTGYTDTTVQSGQTYYYVVTAVNSSNTESAFSSEISAIIP